MIALARRQPRDRPRVRRTGVAGHPARPVDWERQVPSLNGLRAHTHRPPERGPSAPPRGIICFMTQLTTSPRAATRVRFFQALADPSRLALLDALRDGERTAGEAAALAGLSPSNASRHLACLRACGLIEARPVWRHVYYRLAGEHVAHLLREADLVLALVAERAGRARAAELERP